MELFHAHEQWANRPADERFDSLESMFDATSKYADVAVESNDVEYSTLRAEAQNGEVVLVGKKNIPSRLTHWSFGQLAQRAEAPASYLRSLPATLAVQNLNHGLKRRGANDDRANILFHKNGDFVCRAITGQKYSRIWNYEVVGRLIGMQSNGWEPARPDFRLTGNDRPALYASDHDMFAMIRMPNVTVQQPVAGAPNVPMYKGLIYGNSEVGDGTIWVMGFYYNGMCGNHIIWGATGVVEFKAKHVGSVAGRVQQWETEIRRFAGQSTAADEAAMKAATTQRIAATKEQLLDTLFGKRLPGLSRKAIEASYDAVVEAQDGDPLSKWGWVAGATRYSQQTKFADERFALDRAAGKVMQMEF